MEGFAERLTVGGDGGGGGVTTFETYLLLLILVENVPRKLALPSDKSLESPSFTSGA